MPAIIIVEDLVRGTGEVIGGTKTKVREFWREPGQYQEKIEQYFGHSLVDRQGQGTPFS